MLDSLITSKTRMKLLLKFFSNAHTRAYLRGLADELGESTNAIRLELNKLSAAGLLMHEQDGNTILYKANTANPFFGQLHRLVIKYMGVEDIVESIVRKVGDLELACITGNYAKGKDTGIIDLVLVANRLDFDYLGLLHKRAEQISGRKVRMLTLSSEEFVTLAGSLEIDKALILYASPSSGYKISDETRKIFEGDN
jgi:hypothetical protein